MQRLKKHPDKRIKYGNSNKEKSCTTEKSVYSSFWGKTPKRIIGWE